MTYQDSLKAHLVKYKHNALGIKACGTWRAKDGVEREYPHILPHQDLKKNVLAPYRDEFWSDFDSRKVNDHGGQAIKLHEGFSHLNSSQAMCFNLFYPLIKDSVWAAKFSAEILGLKSVDDCKY